MHRIPIQQRWKRCIPHKHRTHGNRKDTKRIHIQRGVMTDATKPHLSLSP